VSGTPRGFESPARTQILTLGVIFFGHMRKILILFTLLTLANCSTQKIQFEIFQLKSEQGDIIYWGIPNNVFYEKWPTENLKVKFRAKENCFLKDNGTFLTITPADSVTYAIIETVFEDSTKRDYIFKVKKLPEPRLYYNLDTEIEKQVLPNTITRSEIKNLFSFEALTPIGSLSWVNFEIRRFDIVVLRGDRIFTSSTNIGPNMSNDNRQLCLKLDAKDVILFRNISLTQGGTQQELIINEKSITIE
jgi:hypothetical protein